MKIIESLQLIGGCYNGNIGIGGDYNNNYRLVVHGKVGIRELIITNSFQWPDYVFESEYKLQPIEERIKELYVNKHLKDIPNAESVHNCGIDISQTITVLTKYVEELHLYINQLNEKIKALEER